MHRNIAVTTITLLAVCWVPPLSAETEQEGEGMDPQHETVIDVGDPALNRLYFEKWARRETELAARPKTQTASATWQFLGPSPVTDGQLATSERAAVNGRCTAVVPDPDNPGTVYLGTASGGVWKSTDGGTNWVHKTDRAAISGIPAGVTLILSIGSLAIDPNNSSIIYAGTGEANFSADCFYGQGILKSTDAGDSWTLLGQSDFGWSSVGAIVIDPTNSNTLYAINATGATSSSTNVQRQAVNPATSVSPIMGVYKSIDGGLTWTLKLAGRGASLVLDPTDHNKLYAGFRNVGQTFGSARGFHYSPDGGTTWNEWNGTRGLPAASSINRTDIDVVSQGVGNPVKIAVVYEGSGSDPTGPYVSSDGGATFTATTLPPTSVFGNRCQCSYDNYIRIDPQVPSTLYYGGVDFNKSTNNGSTWRDIARFPTGGGPGVHPDQHNMGFLPGNSQTFWVVNDGGVYKTTDGGATWINQNAGGLGVLQFQSIAAPGDNSTYLIGGTQDNGTERWDGNVSWPHSADGDGGWAQVHQVQSNVAFHNFYGDEGIEHALDGGESPGSWLAAGAGIVSSDRSSFYNPYVLDPSIPDRMYSGSYRLYRTTTASADSLSWTALTGDLTTGSGDVIEAIAVAPSNSQVIYVGTNVDANIRKSTDGGATFTADIGPVPSPTPGSGITWLEVDPTDANIVYAGMTSLTYPGQHLWKTVNGGTSWTNIDNGNLPTPPVATIAIDPNNHLHLWVGGDYGVYESNDGGATWAPFNTGLPYVPVFMLKYQRARGMLLAATHGRGIWQASVATPPADLFIDQGFLAYLGAQVGQTLDKTFTLRNNGISLLTGNASTSTGSPYAVITGASYSIPAGGSSTVTVRFAPDSVGSFRETVTFTGGGGTTRSLYGTVYPAVPNDHCVDAVVIPSSAPTFTASLDTRGAEATDLTDPVSGCSGRNSHTVWYRVVTPLSGSITFDTGGSDYDTVIAVWDASAASCGALATQIGCDDDGIASGGPSTLTFSSTAGKTYLLEAMSWSDTAGGNLVVNFSNSNPGSSGLEHWDVY